MEISNSGSQCIKEIPAFFFIFFFSSRRRHTRSKRDWSSDVCSSDLFTPARAVRVVGRHLAGTLAFVQRVVGAARSEERRVGKECRCRWWLYHLRKNLGSSSENSHRNTSDRT